MQDLTIITGSSRGLGEAVARHCLHRGHWVIGIARQHSQALDDLALKLGGNLLQWRHDLAAPEPAGWALLEWLQAQSEGPQRFASVTLINNAGALLPPEPLECSEPADLARLLRVGLEAPLLLTGLFLRGTAHWRVPRKVLNVSSGLGRRAMAGSAAYCAAKAGMDHFTRCVALEQARQPNGARLVSLAPGVIDTDMQTQLRSADPAGFPDHARFVALRSDGLLSSADLAATRLLAWLERPEFGELPVVDVRDA